jgi:CBS domain-containing membrane protein
MKLQLFRPILAGANLRDRMIACLGAAIGIGVTALVCTLALGADPRLPMIVAPMGASAVLLFAVPASPLAQPWPVVGGNTISALIGVATGQLVGDHMLADALAVGLAIAAMSLTRSLHPPGGAAALTGAMGGAMVAQWGLLFALAPVGINSLLLTALGWAFHKFSRHSYPHRPAPAPANTHATKDTAPLMRVGFQTADIDAALKEGGEAFDISRADLDRLLRQVEMRALMRSHGEVTCADIMSRDVVSVGTTDMVDKAQSMLIAHGLRTLPVTDGAGRLVGAIGLRELVRATDRVAGVMAQAATASPETPAFNLVPQLTDGRTHAVVVTDPDRKVLGVVTQTDLLAALSRLSAFTAG